MSAAICPGTSRSIPTPASWRAIRRRRAPHEERNLDAKTAEIYAKVGSLAAAQNEALLKRMMANEERLEHESEQNRILLVGIAKLLAQICRAGMVPDWTPEAIAKRQKVMRAINGNQ